MPISIIDNAFVICLSVVLATSVWFDVKFSRIPNLLSLAAAICGIALQGVFFGWKGVESAVGGLGVGLVVFLIPYVIFSMGAGDVKLVAALGTFLGPSQTLRACMVIFIAGGILAIGVLSIKGGRPFLCRYGLMLHRLLTTGRFFYIPATAAETEAMRYRFPYAVAIAIGTFTTLWYAR